MIKLKLYNKSMKLIKICITLLSLLSIITKTPRRGENMQTEAQNMEDYLPDDNSFELNIVNHNEDKEMPNFDNAIINEYFDYYLNINGIEGRNPNIESRDDYLIRLKETNLSYLTEKYEVKDTKDEYPEELEEEKIESDEIIE